MQLGKREFEVASDCFRGIDKDAFLARVCKAYMALIGGALPIQTIGRYAMRLTN